MTNPTLREVLPYAAGLALVAGLTACVGSPSPAASPAGSSSGTSPGTYEVETHHPELRLLKIAVR